MAYEFFAVMQKRMDGKVYADLHKADGRMYLIEEEADAALTEMGDLAKHFHKVKLVAVLADEWHNAKSEPTARLFAQSARLTGCATVADMSNVFAFEWCSCIFESGFSVVSLHDTKRGALREMISTANARWQEERNGQLMYGFGHKKRFDPLVYQAWRVRVIELHNA